MPTIGKETDITTQDVYYIDYGEREEKGERYLVIEPGNSIKSDWNLMSKIADKLGLTVDDLVKKLNSGEVLKY